MSGYAVFAATAATALLLCQLAPALAAVQFAPLPAALTDEAKHQVLSSATATFGNLISSGFSLLMRTGSTPGGSTPFGQLVSATGKPIVTAPGGKVDISNNPDFQSFIKSPDGKLYLVSQFESPQPSMFYISELSQDQATGKLTAVSTRNVDTSSIGGAWITCAGQVTPWNSHLAGEEYEADGKAFELATSIATLPSSVVPFMRYFDKYAAANMTLDEVRQVFSPYNYGQAVEVKVLAGGNTAVERWFTLGRNSKEIAYVMPDQKTVYITDDGTNVGFFKFVAKTAGDLSAGTLYAGKFTQTSDKNGGAFSINWIELGTSDNGALKAKAKTLKFSDMFSFQAPTNGTCPDGFKSINANGIPQECLSLKPGAETWAAFFETRRYAALLGATTEFSKWEGLTFSPKRKKIYTAMTEIRYGMEDNKKKGEPNTQYDIGGGNHVKLPYNPCGCVYELDVDASFNTQSMKATVCGATNGLTDEKNTCSVESIASPDNVSVMDDHDILLIGEDTSEHQNDAVWAYNLNTGSLTRILSTPYGAESTSVYFYPNINGFAYIMAAAQHPYGESDTDKVNGTYSEGLSGYVGYFVVKASDIAGKDIQFTPLPVPRTEEAKAKFAGTPSLVVGTTSSAAYNTLYRSGKRYGKKVMGRLTDSKRRPIRALRSTNLQPYQRRDITNAPDHITLLKTCEALHMVQQYEDTPGLMYVMGVQQDKASGQLSVTRPREVSFSAYGGLWYPCAGMKTQWESHLGSEEYPPDAKTLALATSLADVQADPESGNAIIYQMRYYGKYLPSLTLSDVKKLFKPYMYGRITEAFVDKTGCYKAVKHFAMGRGSFEMALVLPDQKTVLLAEDGQNDAFYKFVANRAGDLSSGTLYAAKFVQQSAENGGAFNINWIMLGSGSDATLAKKAGNVTFNDFFELATPDSAGACPSGFTSVNTGYNGQECLKLKASGSELAPFFETRRFAALKGASTELNKAEGLTYDPVGKKAYLAVTSIEKGMEDNASKGSTSTKYDGGAANDIRLKWNPCGCVYQLDLDASNSPTAMKALMCGQPVNATANMGNACSLEGIANPDNLDIMEGTNTLLIGEDTSNHQNDVLWTYDLTTGSLTRVLSTPYGSEITSPSFYPNVNGFGYILGVVQHPYGESDQDKLTQPGSTGKEAWTGYLGPFKNAGAAPAPFCNDKAGICPRSNKPSRKLF